MRLLTPFHLANARQIITEIRECARTGYVLGDRLQSDVAEVPHTSEPLRHIVLGIIGCLALPLGRRRVESARRGRITTPPGGGGIMGRLCADPVPHFRLGAPTAVLAGRVPDARPLNLEGLENGVLLAGVPALVVGPLVAAAATAGGLLLGLADALVEVELPTAEGLDALGPLQVTPVAVAIRNSSFRVRRRERG